MYVFLVIGKMCYYRFLFLNVILTQPLTGIAVTALTV